MDKPVRWKQRFENFERAYLLLRDAFGKSPENMSDLEKEGVIQRFEYTFELAWKTLKDYLIFNGVIFDQVTPRSVIKHAFAANIIEDGQTWMNMLEQRNLMSHTYNSIIFEEVFSKISRQYLDAIAQVITWLREKIAE
jgi:nucleotidyltransferase substrate binding protein (TIGR01987 family)